MPEPGEKKALRCSRLSWFSSAFYRTVPLEKPGVKCLIHSPVNESAILGFELRPFVFSNLLTQPNLLELGIETE